MEDKARVAQVPDSRARAACCPVPRVSGKLGPRAELLGVALLLVVALLGAATVHIVEYHLGLGSSGDWRASAVAMLARCPLTGGLLVVVLCAGGVGGSVLWELRSLNHRRRQLTTAAGRAGVLPAITRVEAPRDPARFPIVLAPLFLMQFGAYTLVDRLWPMGSLMRMDGSLMRMPINGAVPLLPLQVVVAILLTALVWRLERRLLVLRVVIAAIRRLLPLFSSFDCPVPVPFREGARRLSTWAAPGLLSRPPPCGQGALPVRPLLVA